MSEIRFITTLYNRFTRVTSMILLGWTFEYPLELMPAMCNEIEGGRTIQCKRLRVLRLTGDSFTKP